MEKRGWKGSSDGGEMQRGIIDEEKKLCRTRTYLSKEEKKKILKRLMIISVRRAESARHSM